MRAVAKGVRAKPENNLAAILAKLENDLENSEVITVRKGLSGFFGAHPRSTCCTYNYAGYNG